MFQYLSFAFSKSFVTVYTFLLTFWSLIKSFYREINHKSVHYHGVEPQVSKICILRHK